MTDTREQQNYLQNESAPNPVIEVDIRTMEGDLRALKDAGGETLNLKGEQQSISTEADFQDGNASGLVSSPDKNFIFGEAKNINLKEKPFEPLTSNVETVNVKRLKGDSSVLKTILIILGILVLAAGFGILGYYLSPMVFK